MRLNFRKVSAITSSVLMLGMSIATPVIAASYPNPFVVGGSADVAIVYGTGEGVSALDLTQAQKIKENLELSLGGSGSSTVIGGDSVQLAKSTNKFNLGEATNDFITTLDDGDLSVVLAKGVFTDDGNDEYEYEQEITMESLMLTHFQDSDFNDDKPALGFELADNTKILNYTLDFTPDDAASSTADWNEFEGATIEMLGKEYYILSANNATTTHSGEEITLLDSANSGIVSGDETITVTTAENSYEVSISYIDSDEVKLTINGETTPSLNEDDTYKLDSGDYIGIKDIGFQGITGGSEICEFSIGSGKIELIDGEEVEINGEDISDNYDHILTAYIISQGQNLNKIAIEWQVDDDMWLGFDTNSKSIEMPAFGNIQLSVGNFVTPAEEVTSIEPNSNDRFKLSTTVTDGDVSFDFLYGNGTHFTGIGKDSNELLETTSGDYINWTRNSKWFVVSWDNGADDYESYVLEVSNIEGSDSSKNTTTIKSIATDSDTGITLDVGETDEIGEISFTLDWAEGNEEKYANISVSAASSGNINLSYIYTAEGMRIQLPYEAPYSGDGAIVNITTNGTTSWNMNFTEEDEDGNVASGQNFYITLGFNSNDETSVTTVWDDSMSNSNDYETEDGSDDYVGYINSSLATKVLFDTGGDQDFVDITYHGEEAYAEVYISETGITISGGGGELGEVIVKDTEVGDVSDKNLIVVGGSCINSAAASLVGGSYCTSDWTDATGVGSGQFLIQSFGASDQTLTSKIALLVAGYDASDTVNAATYLRNKDVDTTAGNKYIGTTSTSATLQVTSE